MEKNIIPKSEITRALVSKILKQYFHDYQPFSFKWISLGIENQTVKVDIRNKKYVLRIYNRFQFGVFKRTSSSILWELDFMEHVRRGGVPVPKVIPTLEQKKLAEINLHGKKYFVVTSKFIGGHHIKKLSPEQTKAVIRCQALLHKLSKNFYTPYKRANSLQYGFEEWVLRNRDTKVSKYPTQAPLLMELWAIVDNFYPRLVRLIQSRAKYAIHNDLNRENFKFSGDKIVGVFDFDDALLGVPIGELGKTIFFIVDRSIKPELLDERISQAMEYYSDVIKLSLPSRQIVRLSFIVSWASRRFAQFEGKAEDVKKAKACIKYLRFMNR